MPQPKIGKHPTTGGLSNSPTTLHQLVQMAAEGNSEDIGNPEDASVTDELVEVIEQFDQAVWEALNEIVQTLPPQNDEDAFSLWFAEGPYLILMTLQGHGVGIWDGSWKDFYTPKQLDSIQTFLEKRLGKFADSSGSGLIDQQLHEAAYNTTTGVDPESDMLV